MSDAKMVVLWLLLILAVSVPLAARLYRRRTRD